MKSATHKKTPIVPEGQPRNVIDHLQWIKTSEIETLLAQDRINLSLLLVNIERDNNLGNIIRSANTFGVQEIIIYGRKKFDRRTSVGAEYFMKFRHIRFVEEIDSLLTEFEVVLGLEQSKKSQYIRTFQWEFDKKTLLMVGHEGLGLPPDLLKKCQITLEIEQFGSTRSLNVSVATAIALYDYRCKYLCQ